MKASCAKKPSPPSTATPRPTPCPERTETRERRGFIALGHLYDYADHVVYRHEQTFPKHKSDRLALFKAIRAYPEQIYMLYSDPTFTAEHLIFETQNGQPRPADLEITDEYGVLHRVWKLTDPILIGKVLENMSDKWLLIADGHHRYETSVAYMHERAKELGLDRRLSELVISAAKRDVEILVLQTRGREGTSLPPHPSPKPP